MPTMIKTFSIEINDGKIVGTPFLGTIKKGEEYTQQITAIIKDADGYEYLPSGNFSAYLHYKRPDGYKNRIPMDYSSTKEKWFINLGIEHTKVAGTLECNIEVTSKVTDYSDTDTQNILERDLTETQYENAIM